MSDEIRAMLEEDVKRGFEVMSALDPESKEFKEISEDVQNKIRLLNEDNKTTADYDIKYRTLENEREDKEKQYAEQEKDRRLKVGMWAIGGVGSTISIWAIAKNVLKFEETGALVSSVGKSFFGSLFRWKK